ncbi:DivIVA domain-containing protein [Micrococcus flavus]|uniref:Cell wall synthesis protein Wag31 n=1 Tax=Micrococcus flavus TaxID=384602 RepID=A0A4Y8X512_9MICC|nr:DivIVA domain-containing protein [Micrococcus flavus]MBB4883167.1 DivIVA domain-containing protein [Micrococcus flavus]TFI04570.1 DivIVA domain-containing protein [Micrococcus flavus]GGK42939.1 DivIVA domain-containing protein [Micrococcus flavus]
MTTSHDAPGFDHVESDEIGYEPSHVDAFLDRARRAERGEGSLTAEDVRQARFATVNGGYAADQVDDELDRLEEALTSRERESSQDDEAWSSALAQDSAELVARADRAPAERFRRPSSDDAQSYDVDQVDALLDRLRAALDGDGDLTADDVRRASFGSADGREGYDEAQVDAYLDAAVDVLLRRG